MEILVSLSAKSLGDIYHSTSLNSFLKILRSGMFGLTTGRAQANEQNLQSGYSFFGSFTRSRAGQYHHDKSNCVMLTFDGTKLSNKYKFASVDYWRGHKRNQRTEAEERLLSDKSELPILSYLKRVDIVTNGNPDKTTAAWYGLASVESYLKRHKIPFAYYPDMKSWTFKRGAFTPVGTKSVGKQRKSNVDQFDYEELRQFLSMLVDPCEAMDAKTLKQCDLIYGRDTQELVYVQRAMSVFDSTRDPNQPAPVRTISTKITRTMKYLNLSSAEDVSKFVKAKYEPYLLKIQTEDRIKTANAVADRLVRLLNPSVLESDLLPVELRLIQNDPEMNRADDAVSDINYFIKQVGDVSNFGPNVALLVKNYGATKSGKVKLNSQKLCQAIAEVRGI
jgi:hypothetical protein